MDCITPITEKLLEYLPELVKAHASEVESLAELEVAVKASMHEVGNALVGHMLEAQEDKYPASARQCPHCEEKADYVRRREAQVITLHGRVAYRRQYYGCAHCGHGHCPLDDRLGIRPGEMSDEVIQIAALLGVQEAFGTSSDLLARTTLVELSPNSIRKACQVMGERATAIEEALQADSQDLGRQLQHARQTPPKRLCASLDGFMVHFKDGWHEMKAGVWWIPDDQEHPQAIHYYTDTASAEEFSELVWATGFAHLADQAEELIFVTDGAEWIERLIRQHFPHAILIIDWYHACQYLTPIATLAGPSPPQQQAWLETVTTDLWHGQIDLVIAACQALVRSDLGVDDDLAQQAVRYFTNHRDRMDYPTYSECHYPIGSGTMESGCKQLGLGRLKIAGARWGQDRDSARLVGKARAAYLSGQWDALRSAPAA